VSRPWLPFKSDLLVIWVRAMHLIDQTGAPLCVPERLVVRSHKIICQRNDPLAVTISGPLEPLPGSP
jgi:hypothetical protein